MNKLIVEFEKHEVVKDFMDIFDVYHTNLGGYRYSKDGSPCYQLNGMLIMFEEQQKKIDLLEKELTETQVFLNKQNHIKQIKIDELQSRVVELTKAMSEVQMMSHKSISYEHDLFDKGWNQASKQVVINIHRLTGIGEGLLK